MNQEVLEKLLSLKLEEDYWEGIEGRFQMLEVQTGVVAAGCKGVELEDRERVGIAELLEGWAGRVLA